MTAPDLAAKLAAAEAKLVPSYTNTVLAGLQIPWPLCTTLPGILDARRAARDAGYTVVLLSAESIKAIRAALRAGLPPGGEALTRDLAAALETPLLARSPTEGA